MKTSHAGMGISGSDWNVFMRHAAATLDHFGVPAREKDEVLAFFTSLRGEIVEQRYRSRLHEARFGSTPRERGGDRRGKPRTLSLDAKACLGDRKEGRES